jgi:hypothetical protein
MRKSVRIYFRRINEISLRHVTFFRHADLAENLDACAAKPPTVQGLKGLPLQLLPKIAKNSRLVLSANRRSGIRPRQGDGSGIHQQSTGCPAKRTDCPAKQAF